MIELLPKDKNATNKTALGLGLCKLFSARGIPMVLSLLKYGYDSMLVNLNEAVYANHIVNNLKHPDMHIWEKSIREDEERVRNAKNNISKGNFDIAQLKENFQIFQNKKQETDKLNKFYASGFKVGRNDPCPCGSGKKFKNCCGKA
jgi:preprotein translocase subunit SecA